MTTRLIEAIDPTGEHHRVLGYLAAEQLFLSCPDGYTTDDMLNAIQARAESAIRRRLEPLGATLDDLKVAVRLTAVHFGERYTELVCEARSKAGHA